MLQLLMFCVPTKLVYSRKLFCGNSYIGRDRHFMTFVTTDFFGLSCTNQNKIMVEKKLGYL
jgi:hypothetical protein